MYTLAAMAGLPIRRNRQRGIPSGSQSGSVSGVSSGMRWDRGSNGCPCCDRRASAAAATGVAQSDHLDVLATVEWAVGLGLIVPLVICIIAFFWIAFRVPKSQRDEARTASSVSGEMAEANLVIDLRDGIVIGSEGESAASASKGANSEHRHKHRACACTARDSHVRRAAVCAHARGRAPAPEMSYDLPLLGPYRAVSTWPHGRILAVHRSAGDPGRVSANVEIGSAGFASGGGYRPVQRWEGGFNWRADYAQQRVVVDAMAPVSVFARSAAKVTR